MCTRTGYELYELLLFIEQDKQTTVSLHWQRKNFWQGWVGMGLTLSIYSNAVCSPEGSRDMALLKFLFSDKNYSGTFAQ